MPAGPTITVSHAWNAMGTRFEAFLVGDDAEHLEATASAFEEESRRLESVLSRYDPASEVSRINRVAHSLPVRLDVEVWKLLLTCDGFRRRTEGYFDITAGSRTTDTPTPGLHFDPASRSIRRTSHEVWIDLGGIGKGYALDRMCDLLHDNAIPAALLHAGTSSILAHGPNTWEITLADLDGSPLGSVKLAAGGFSYSATRRPGQAVSDIIDPGNHLPLTGQDACVVFAATATEAEALSTGLLAMGRERATRYAQATTWPGVRVGWIAPSGLDWLKEAA